MFLKGNDSVCLVPMDTMDKLKDRIESRLKTRTIKTSVSGTNLIGLYTAMNQSGIILPQLALDSEVETLRKEGLNVHVSFENMNAHGNNIVANDKGGIINPVVSDEERRKMEDVLGVELIPMSIAGHNTVGSCAIATNRGFLTHYKTSEDELKKIEKALHVKGSRGTVNLGVGFVGMGALVNSNGYLVGEKTSAHEIGRLEEAFDMIMLKHENNAAL
jgi:translation initiation factor 6